MKDLVGVKILAGEAAASPNSPMRILMHIITIINRLCAYVELIFTESIAYIIINS